MEVDNGIGVALPGSGAVKTHFPVGGNSKKNGGQGIFKDSSGESIEVWIDTALRDRIPLVRYVLQEGGSIAVDHTEENVHLLILSPGSTAIFDMYCHPDWMTNIDRRMYEKKRRRRGNFEEEWTKKVLLKAWWLEECKDTGRFLGFDDNWAGCRAGGPPLGVAMDNSDQAGQIPLSEKDAITQQAYRPPTPQSSADESLNRTQMPISSQVDMDIDNDDSQSENAVGADHRFPMSCHIQSAPHLPMDLTHHKQTSPVELFIHKPTDPVLARQMSTDPIPPVNPQLGLPPPPPSSVPESAPYRLGEWRPVISDTLPMIPELGGWKVPYMQDDALLQRYDGTAMLTKGELWEEPKEDDDDDDQSDNQSYRPDAEDDDTEMRSESDSDDYETDSDASEDLQLVPSPRYSVRTDNFDYYARDKMDKIMYDIRAGFQTAIFPSMYKAHSAIDELIEGYRDHIRAAEEEHATAHSKMAETWTDYGNQLMDWRNDLRRAATKVHEELNIEKETVAVLKREAYERKKEIDKLKLEKEALEMELNSYKVSPSLAVPTSPGGSTMSDYDRLSDQDMRELRAGMEKLPGEEEPVG